MKHLLKLLCIAVVMSLLAACGDGTTAGDTTTTSAPDGATTTTAALTTTPTADSGADDGDDGGPMVPVCAGTEAMNEAFEGYDDALSGEEMDYDEAIRQIQAAVQAAPAEIRDDFQIVADEVVNVFNVLKEIDLEPGAIPTEDQLEQMMAVGEGMETEQVTAAAERLQNWFDENCS